ncbi:MAG TPA: hypothetical protein VN606_09105 [Thermoleophilaceae bacterium]|nr:hypothetical protein [Thermoleophilaceae bacterium]
MVTHRRPGGRPCLQWDIDFADSIGDCAPSDLAGELLPTPRPSSGGAANHERTVHPKFAVSGHGFPAKVTLKKVVIPDGWADTRPQRLFVCK